MAVQTKAMKKVLGVVSPAGMHWVGDGFPVRSMFTYDDAAELLSPFLLLDYAAPTKFGPTEHPRGVGEHPHRGFETVTIAYQGEIEHRDSSGAGGKIGSGDVQWMTAASGVVHEEFHSRDFARTGGTLEMVQLWVNLPAKDKMSKPRYQDLRAAQFPVVKVPGGLVRVIAGSFDGQKGPARTFTPVELWNVELGAGATFETTLPEGYTTALLVRSGEVAVNGSSARDAQLVVLVRSGTSVAITATTDAKLLLLAGQPIDEPVVGHGPFVMNTAEEIRQAFRDYQLGRMGTLPER